MASSRSAAPRMQKCLQIGVSGRVDRTLAFQELGADTGGLDNERTMSDADGGGPLAPAVAALFDAVTRRPFGPRRALRLRASAMTGARRAIPQPTSTAVAPLRSSTGAAVTRERNMRLLTPGIRPFEEPDARWHGHAGGRRAGARRRTAKTRRWLRPTRLGIGASNCATRSAPSSNSCAAPSRSYARNSIRRTRRSEAADSAIRTQARRSGSSPMPGPGAAVAFGRRCENVSCSSGHSRAGVEARGQPPGESVSDHVQGGPLALHSHGPGRRSAGGRKGAGSIQAARTEQNRRLSGGFVSPGQ